MTDNIILICFGVLLIGLGILNCFGYIKTLHWYHRKNITEATRKPYGRSVGIGTILFGVSMIVCALVDWIFKSETASSISLLIGFAIGLGFILYGQFKYNKGLF